MSPSVSRKSSTDAGPAAANLMGGIVNSWGDSVPVLFLAGHNERTKVASKFTKEIPFLDIFAPVSKWSAMIDDPSKVAETLRRAFMHMRTGRPGPVALGVPVDVAQMEVGNFEYLPVSPRPRVRSGADPDAINAAVDLIANAERPYVYVGAGILFSEATDELVRFAELLTLPVTGLRVMAALTANGWVDVRLLVAPLAMTVCAPPAVAGTLNEPDPTPGVLAKIVATACAAALSR